MSWIAALTEKPPVKAVTDLRVVGNQTRARRHGLSISQRQRHRVVAVLSELLVGFRGQPSLPSVLDVVNWIVNAWSGKALNVNRPDIMVSHRWKNCNARAFKVRVNFFGN